jgi:hypothetical protein
VSEATPYTWWPCQRALFLAGNCWVWKTQQHCSSWHKLLHLAHTTITHSKTLQSALLPNHPLNGTHTQSMFCFPRWRSSQTSICLVPSCVYIIFLYIFLISIYELNILFCNPPHPMWFESAIFLHFLRI